MLILYTNVVRIWSFCFVDEYLPLLNAKLLAKGTMKIKSVGYGCNQPGSYIGKSAWSVDGLTVGSVDQLRVFNTSLSPKEIKMLYYEATPFQ